LRPGDAVPSEVQIGRDLHVSRGSVREAYRTLAALGVLDIEGGRKPRLRALDSKAFAQVFDYALNTAQVSVAHVTETRRALELHTAQLAARHASDVQRLHLRHLVEEMRSALNDHASRMACDMAIHSAIAEASGNPLNALLLSALRSSVETSSRRLVEDNRSESDLIRVIDAHDAVVERICDADPIGAAAAMSYHFDLSVLDANHVQECESNKPYPDSQGSFAMRAESLRAVAGSGI
jgi:GntR family transcriptional regulator, transcriptional repressor for pyruvate dehydrogenase complex